MKEIRAKYQTHIAAMFRLAGLSDPEARAARVLALETAIAKAADLPRRQRKHPQANNPWDPADFTAKAPGLDWPEFFRAAGLDKQHSFIVWQPTPSPAKPPSSPRNPSTPGKISSPITSSRPTPQAPPKPSPTSASPSSARRSPAPPSSVRATSAATASSPLLSAKPSAKSTPQRYFPPEAKAQAEALVANLIAAFRERLESLTWMAPATKAEAIAKLGTLQVGIGYPDHWRSYAASMSRPTTSSATSGAPASSNTTTHSAASASPSTAKSGA